MARKKWKPPRDRNPSCTLFDPNFKKHIPKGKEWSYASTVVGLHWNDDRRFYDQELGIFQDLIESDQDLCADIDRGNGMLAGDLTVKVGNEKAFRLEWNGKSFFELPPWVEADNLVFQSCRARGILLMEKASAFHYLWKAKAWVDLGLVLACGGGIPRWRMRRVLHRLSTQFRIPVYVFADNDTWGYYIFSVLKRGMMAPHESCPQLAVQDLRFLGLRPGEYIACGSREQCTLRWRKRWDLRLKFMRKYPCFRSKAWQREFDRLKKQNATYEMECVLGRLGVERTIREFLLPKLKNRDWLS